jgi:hypothetical protein
MPPLTTDQPTETSPLLPRSDQQNTEIATPPIDASSGIAPEGAEVHDATSAIDGGDLERHASNGETSRHVGMPEVKKRMKYIFPAVAIGVRPALVLYLPVRDGLTSS